MFLGFFAWYRGLAIGPMAQVSQVQLVQPVLSICWAALLLGEHVSLATVLGAPAVIVTAGSAVRARSEGRRHPQPGESTARGGARASPRRAADVVGPDRRIAPRRSGPRSVTLHRQWWRPVTVNDFSIVACDELPAYTSISPGSTTKRPRLS